MLGGLVAVLLALAGCQALLRDPYVGSIGPSSNPQTVEAVERNDPQAEIGAREHPRILATYGGEYRDEKTERLVARIVGGLTAVSENPDQSFRITILDSPAINAFALPGGYLYVTRGLLALANDASEVAAVLAHEMAHVTANHGIERQQREQAEVIASRVVEEVLSSRIAGKEALARGKLRLAAFSRAQELQADVIGIRMLGKAGYDPYAASRFLRTMAAYSAYTAAETGGDQSLDFLSSHPDAPQRVDLAWRHARAIGPEGIGESGRTYFLDGIDGLLFGDRPEQGYVRDRQFIHPELRIRFEVPDGFRIDNTATAVLATGPGDVAIRFDSVEIPPRRSLIDYLQSGWVTGLIEGSAQDITINGLEAATARARADRWDFDITVVRVEDRVYRILVAAPSESPTFETTANAFRNSFRQMSESEADAISPLRVRTVTVRPGDSVYSLASRNVGIERKVAFFRAINGLEPSAVLEPGRKIKIVTDQ